MKLCFGNILVMLLFSITLLGSDAPIVNFKHYSSRDGLEQSFINTILQDDRGFLWLSGQRGVVSWDGDTFNDLRHNPENSNSLSHDMTVELKLHGDTLWIATVHGLNALNVNTYENKRYLAQENVADSLPANQIRCIDLTPQGDLWVGTEGGLALLKDQEFIRYRLFPNKDASIASVHQGQKTTYVATGDGSLFEKDGEGFVVINWEKKNNTEYIELIREDVHGLWIGTNHGSLLLRRPNGIWVRIDGIDSFIMDMEPASDGGYWIASKASGLYYYDFLKDELHQYLTDPANPSSISHNNLSCLFTDRDGGFWVGTVYGINYALPIQDHFKHFRHQSKNPQSLSHDFVTSFCKDNQGRLWIGTYGGGINIQTEDGYEKIEADPNGDQGPLSNTLISMAKDDLGQIWIGSQDGVDLYRDGRFLHFFNDPEQENSIPGGNILAIRITSKNTIWVSSRSGFAKINGETLEIEANPFDELKNSWVLDILEDEKGRLWFATLNNGLFVVGPDGMREFRKLNFKNGEIANNGLIDLHESHGLIWVGSEQGLLGYDPESRETKRYGVEQGCASDLVYAILEDEKGNFWLSSNAGITRFHPKTLDVQVYDKADGIENEYNNGAAFYDEKGLMYFGSINGYSQFIPKNIKEPVKELDVWVMDLFVDNETDQSLLKPTGAQELEKAALVPIGFETRFFTLHFTSPNFISSPSSRYAYRLDPFDDDWHYTDARNRIATYTNIDHGSYVFRVKAENKAGLWGKETLVKIKIEPAPWETWWAIGFYLMLFCGLFYYLHRRQRLEYEREKEAHEKMKKIEAMKEEFLANTTHELRTPLSGIIGLAESLLGGAAGTVNPILDANLRMIISSGKRLNAAVGDILDFSVIKSHGIDLNFRALDLNVLSQVVIAFSRPLVGEKKLTIENRIPPNFPLIWADENRLQQILFNLLQSSIKFSSEGIIFVEVVHQDKQAFIRVGNYCTTISDKVKSEIFQFFEDRDWLRNTQTTKSSHLGLAVTKRLVELHGGNISVSFKEGCLFEFQMTFAPKEKQADETRITQANATVAALDTDTIQPSCQTEHAQFANYRILVADGDRINRQLLLNNLSSLTNNLEQAQDGQEVLARFDHGQAYDMLLIDMVIPSIDGLSLCRQLRQRFPRHEMPILLLTSQYRKDDLVEGFKAGANDYITKPISRDELLVRMSTHLHFLDISRNLERKATERTQNMAILSEIGREITSSLDLDRIMMMVYTHVNSLMDAHAFGIALLEEDQERLEFKLIEDGKRYPNSYVNMADDRRLAVWCVKNKGEVIIEQPEDERQYLGVVSSVHVGADTQSVIYLPLMIGDRVIGAITVQSLYLNAYTPYQIDMVRTLASYTAIAMDNASAYQIVEKKNREIISTQQQMVMQEKMASLGILTAGVAHEINNPTHFTYFGTQNLKKDLDKFQTFLLRLAEDADAEIIEEFDSRFQMLNKHLTTIQEGTARISRIVKDLRAFTRLGEAQRKRVHITESLASTLNLVRTQFSEVATFVDDFKVSPELDCWPAQLNQVFMNLIVNACQAIEERLKIDPTVPGRLEVKTYIEDTWFKIRIQDNGCGMSEDVKRSIFEPFFTTKEVGTGTGLGLSISYKIMEDHGGHFEIESEEGKGTNFILCLPLESERPADLDEEGDKALSITLSDITAGVNKGKIIIKKDHSN